MKNDDFCIDLKDGNWTKSYVESVIYNFFKTVAGANNILEKNEIRNYCNRDGKKLELAYMFKDILRVIQEDLEIQKYIKVIPTQNYILFKTQPKIILSKELIKEYQNLKGLNNFLIDYSNMDEKQHIEVYIWEDYLVFSNLLGIADRVKKQFKKIYPNLNGDRSMFEVSFDNTIVGALNTGYKVLKRQFFILLATILLCAIIFSWSYY